MKRYLPFLPVLVTALASWLIVQAAEEKKTPPLRVLLVLGGCCHDYENQKMILAEGLSARANVEFTIIHEEGPEGKKDKTHRISIYEKEDWDIC